MTRATNDIFILKRQAKGWEVYAPLLRIRKRFRTRQAAREYLKTAVKAFDEWWDRQAQMGREAIPQEILDEVKTWCEITKP